MSDLTQISQLLVGTTGFAMIVLLVIWAVVGLRHEPTEKGDDCFGPYDL